MTTRRQILVALGLGVLTASLPAFGQQLGKVWRIGVIHTGTRETPVASYASFFDALQSLGYVNGRNISVQRLYADNDLRRLPALAAEFVNARVDLIVTNGTQATLAAQRATSSIAILGTALGDPVGSGIAKSLARPGGNITGTAGLNETLMIKRLEILAEIAPHAPRIAVMVNPDNPVSMRLLPAVEAGARKMGRELSVVFVRNESELAAAFDQLSRQRAGALYAAADSVINALAKPIGQLALQHKLPTVFPVGAAADFGVICYGPNFRELSRSAAVIAAKIFKGVNPGDIPFEQATHFELVANLKNARALGITIPSAVMVRATRVIE